MLWIRSLVHVVGAFFCIAAHDVQAPRPSHDADTTSQPPTTAARATVAETSHPASSAPHDHENDLELWNEVACRDISLASDAPPTPSTSSSSRTPRLPPELLLQIIELVVEVPFSSDVERIRATKPPLEKPFPLTPTPYGTLANVCLASREFCRLAQPVMYRDIVITAESVTPYNNLVSPHPLQTLQIREDLASQVKQLHFVSWKCYCVCRGIHGLSPPFFPLLRNLETLVMPECTLRLGFQDANTRWLFRKAFRSLPRLSTLIVMKEDSWFGPRKPSGRRPCDGSLPENGVWYPDGRKQAFDLTPYQQ
ncbi:uncharacterized protein RHTO_06456 [Rhodotorula toruloides NP11]|uniref:Uncharacterized protein n=1 Tax=Rhodotorula toruloides (strain NP11) TaxID=1130832 RepID=M7XDZ0_RHOT1|nr:uncharacterized protein RHTO_06456 [Rhodotorula toruloides NP11]EMS18313.1 hypothetical protein RHTO_06456 [Rhodotorula toruloides NP11]